MKIAIVNQPPGPVDRNRLSGSIAILTYNIAARLKQQFDVVIYSTKTSGQPRTQIDEHVLYRRFGVWLDGQLLKIVGKFRGFRADDKPLFSSSIFYIFFVLKVAIDARKQKCRVIHLMNYVQFVSIIRFFNPTSKIILHMSCEWLSQINSELVTKHLAKVDVVVSCSKHVSSEIQKVFPDFAQKCRTIYNGVSLPKTVREKAIPSNGKAGKILFVGRLSPEKGVHTLLEAFDKLLATRPEAELVVIGPKRQAPPEYIVQLSRDQRVRQLRSYYNGGDRRTYSRQLANYPVAKSGSVHFPGSVPSHEIQRYYDGADVLVQPSYTEALGITVLEAFASGVPVVGSETGGIPELIRHNETGLLCKVGDATALATAIERILSSSAHRKRMGQNARQLVADEFTWKKVGGQWSALYTDLVKT